MRVFPAAAPIRYALTSAVTRRAVGSPAVTRRAVRSLAVAWRSVSRPAVTRRRRSGLAATTASEVAVPVPDVADATMHPAQGGLLFVSVGAAACRDQRVAIHVDAPAAPQIAAARHALRRGRLRPANRGEEQGGYRSDNDFHRASSD